jgi:hypothetical protein
MNYGAPPPADRLLGFCLSVLAAAVALVVAVHLLLSVVWVVLGIAGLIVTAAVCWRLWQRHSGW